MPPPTLNSEEPDNVLSQPIEFSLRDARKRRVGVDRPPNHHFGHATFTQLLAQEVVAVDADAGYAHNLLQEFDRLLFSLVPLGFRHLPAACVMLQVSPISDVFTVSARFVETAPHVIPLHSVVASP